MNLNNEYVSTVTIFYKHPNFPAYLETLPVQLKNKSKIILFEQPEEPTVKLIFQYINDYLVNKVVIFMHQDNVLDNESAKLNDFFSIRM